MRFDRAIAADQAGFVHCPAAPTARRGRVETKRRWIPLRPPAGWSSAAGSIDMGRVREKQAAGRGRKRRLQSCDFGGRQPCPAGRRVRSAAERPTRRLSGRHLFAVEIEAALIAKKIRKLEPVSARSRQAGIASFSKPAERVSVAARAGRHGLPNETRQPGNKRGQSGQPDGERAVRIEAAGLADCAEHRDCRPARRRREPMSRHCRKRRPNPARSGR